MKKFVLGLLIGAILSMTSVAFAGTEVKAVFTSFNFLVDGEEKQLDKDPIVVNGSSYLPVRSVANMLGYDVGYDSSTRTIILTSQAKPSIPLSEIGLSRSNPADIGTSVTFKIGDIIFGDGKAELTVVSIIRGDEAWKMVNEANPYNEPAPEGYEYMLAMVNFEVLEGSDAQYGLTSYNFNLVSSEGKDYEKPTVVLPDPPIDAKLYVGAANEGYVAFLVDKTDEKPLIVYGKDYSGKGGAWIKGYLE